MLNYSIVRTSLECPKLFLKATNLCKKNSIICSSAKIFRTWNEVKSFVSVSRTELFFFYCLMNQLVGHQTPTQNNFCAFFSKNKLDSLSVSRRCCCRWCCRCCCRCQHCRCCCRRCQCSRCCVTAGHWQKKIALLDALK